MLRIQSEPSTHRGDRSPELSLQSASPSPSGDPQGSNRVSLGFQQGMAWMQVAIVTARQVTTAPLWQGWMRVDEEKTCCGEKRGAEEMG